MSANFYFKPSDQDFKAYKGYLPKNGVFNALKAYDKYVVGEGRNIPLNLWLGTALKETTLGKYFRDDQGELVAMPKGEVHNNPMQAMPDDDKYWKQASGKYGGRFAGGDFSEVGDAMVKRGVDPLIDFAGYKLQEGIDKFKTPERASRWFNMNDPAPRKKIPHLGQDLLKNSTVQQIIKNIKDNYTGQQWVDRLKTNDQPLEGMF